MAIFDRFKIKKPPQEKKEVKKPESRKETPPKTPFVTKTKTTVSDRIFQILKSPHITEKATDLMKNNHYVFKVFQDSNKTEIKKAIEALYEVDVLDVKILKSPKKRRRFGKISGWKKGFKKTIVKIKEGQKIEILPR